jgi:hypothetical protein
MSTYRAEPGHDADGIEDGWAVIRTFDADDMDDDDEMPDEITAVVSTESVAELLIAALSGSMTFNLACVTKHGERPTTPQPGRSVKVAHDGGSGNLTVDIEGCGLNTMEQDGRVLYLENQDGNPKLYVWADINREEPTHVLDLAGALETARVPDFPEWGILSDAKLTTAVSVAKRAARREASEQLGFVQSRGVYLCTSNKEGQAPPNIEAECPDWHNTSDEIRTLAAEVMTKWPNVDTIYISGGYDWAENRAEMETGNYQPWASEWSVTVWTRKDGYAAELRD